MDAFKVTIGKRNFWYRNLRDGVATVMTDDDDLKRVLYRTHVMFPDAVDLMYDGEDLCEDDFDGTTTFILNTKRVELFFKQDEEDVGIRIYEDDYEYKVIDLEEGAAL